MSPWGLARTLLWAKILAAGGESSQNATSWGSGLLFQAWCGGAVWCFLQGRAVGGEGASLSTGRNENAKQDRFWEGLAETPRMGFRSLLPSSGQGLEVLGRRERAADVQEQLQPPGACAQIQAVQGGRSLGLLLHKVRIPRGAPSGPEGSSGCPQPPAPAGTARHHN